MKHQQWSPCFKSNFISLAITFLQTISSSNGKCNPPDSRFGDTSRIQILGSRFAIRGSTSSQVGVLHECREFNFWFYHWFRFSILFLASWRLKRNDCTHSITALQGISLKSNQRSENKILASSFVVPWVPRLFPRKSFHAKHFSRPPCITGTSL